MARRRKNIVLEKVTIIDVGSEGKAIAKTEDNMTVFVTGAVTGDVCDLQVTKKRKTFMEARPIKFYEYSDKRVEPFCEHFGVCGGCKWQMLDYKWQLHYKQKQVVDQLTRIGKIDLPEIESILGSEQTREYRNKMDFTFTSNRWLTKEQMETEDPTRENRGIGLHLPGMWNKVLHLNDCYLQNKPSDEIRKEAYQFVLDNNLTAFNHYDEKGLLRNLIIRTSSTKDLMVMVQFHDNDQEQIDLFMENLKVKFPQITSLLYVINQKKNDSYHDLDFKVYNGLPYIVEEMEGLKFRVGPKSFYQTNSDQAYNLYKVAREFADLTGEERVYDLYTGTGTIAQFVSRKAKEVIGIEYVEDAIKDAKINSELNSIDNCKFFAGDMKDILTKNFIKKHGDPDVIITDPPRAGMHEAVINQILEVEPKRIVYVSCNPATQARDLALLDPKYKVTRVMPVDMFPQTYHVENVVALELK
ncbi:23S rRNA (uracil(1939)-C(5))-methyltransferase RlmD [Flammeovirga kamogawensis]|uniref:23S rRNA (Uracil(1939)-C(5))-methyltransferase RlmD n=1 Tax=Flammeovirga kamogawensis TaxID=373891 RepID=A0ABX8GX13_9BACT|nr:23S rRNA (uracil(1939)-C(5))-methyltransferase RlmD [Flammeovirga kamogawensis]MBB6460580.1 23S rRNA (uracil1939-C5)-methyltransferase [Flammeovirga kamogawensis]QWG07938.1 23S rRNA (uracil(1939)-C(5))-methyltransferase RlmD [Flammeovirga kamogawensis]TRX69747.1 23S rRNA (uracil(1939)-C(5))-methyltransferase RlmD [Flammeovirga kamogawensis]